MFNLKTEIEKASQNKKAIGHFNISNFEMLKAIFLAGQAVSQTKGESVPLIIGLSEGERRFVGTRQIADFIKSWREENNYPVFINADHCHSLESVKEACEAGFDSVVVDNSNFSLEENIEKTKQVVDFVRINHPGVLLEGELGAIGEHSALLGSVPAEVKIGENQLTTAGEVFKFVEETKVDLVAPAVGNIHGMLKDAFNPDLDIERIKEIKEVITIPLVLHGGSGIRNKETEEAVLAGMAVVHISTELRRTYSLEIQNLAKYFFVTNPDEVVPYKIMKSVIDSLQQLIEKKLELFN